MVMEKSKVFDLLADKVHNLTAHSDSYIAKSQARYFNNLKESISQNLGTCLAWADFAESYSMVIQDDVQNWHWTKQQCTAHPIVLYYSERKEMIVKSLVIISDDLQHDTI